MKKLIVSAVFCLTAVQAHAEFTPYANILVGMQAGQSFNQGTVPTTSGQLQNATLIEDYGSFIGFRGNENVNPNLHFVWQVEQYITVDSSSTAGEKNTLANKDSYLGLLGAFGSVRLGRMSLLPKSDMEYVDPWEYDGKSVNGLTEFARLDGRLNNAIKYESPGYFGTKLAVLYSPDEQKTAEGVSKDAINVGLFYKDATYLAGYSYYTKSNTNNGKDADIWHRLEVAYDQKTWMLALGYQSVKGYTEALAYNLTAYAKKTGAALTGAEEIQGTEVSATLNYTYQENLTYRLSYAIGEDLKINGVDAKDTGYTHAVFGVSYRLSEKAKAFANYGLVNWKGNYAGTSDKIVENNASVGMGLDI